MEVNQRMSWNEIVKKYPAMWVFLKDVKYEYEGSPTIVSAIVFDTANDGNVDDKTDFYIDSGINFLSRRTFDSINMGVINCENYRLNVR